MDIYSAKILNSYKSEIGFLTRKYDNCLERLTTFAEIVTSHYLVPEPLRVTKLNLPSQLFENVANASNAKKKENEKILANLGEDTSERRLASIASQSEMTAKIEGGSASDWSDAVGVAAAQDKDRDIIEGMHRFQVELLGLDGEKERLEARILQSGKARGLDKQLSKNPNSYNSDYLGCIMEGSLPGFKERREYARQVLKELVNLLYPEPDLVDKITAGAKLAVKLHEIGSSVAKDCQGSNKVLEQFVEVPAGQTYLKPAPQPGVNWPDITLLVVCVGAAIVQKVRMKWASKNK